MLILGIAIEIVICKSRVEQDRIRLRENAKLYSVETDFSLHNTLHSFKQTPLSGRKHLKPMLRKLNSP